MMIINTYCNRSCEFPLYKSCLITNCPPTLKIGLQSNDKEIPETCEGNMTSLGLILVSLHIQCLIMTWLHHNKLVCRCETPELLLHTPLVSEPGQGKENYASQYPIVSLLWYQVWSKVSVPILLQQMQTLFFWGFSQVDTY